MKKIISKSKNNLEIYIGEETIAHMKAHSDVSLKHIQEAINSVTLSDTFFMRAIDLGRMVGKDHCIYIPKEKWNEVQMFQRPNRKGLTPMIKSNPQDTSLITIGICIDDDGLWTLFTAFYGVKAPREPWDPNIKSEEEKAESEEFWNCHALCY